MHLVTRSRISGHLVRLAHNELGLSRLLVKELRELEIGKRQEVPATGERVPYDTLDEESSQVRVRLDREQKEQERLARERHLRDVRL